MIFAGLTRAADGACASSPGAAARRRQSWRALVAVSRRAILAQYLRIGFYDAGGGTKSTEPEVVELDENSELARLIASSDRNKYDTIRRYLIENFGGRELELSDGKKAVIDKSDAKELAHKAYDKRVSELSELEKLVKYATFIKQVGDVEHNKFQAFRYYIVKTKYKGNIGRIVLNVGIDKNAGKLHLYSITNYPKDK